MARFRKKPLEIDAVRWTGENWTEIIEFLADHFTNPYRVVTHDPDAHSLLVSTLEGRMRCAAGEWLVKDATGEYRPCENDVFDQTYEQVYERECA